MAEITARVTKDEFRILVKAMKATYIQPGFLPDDDAAQVWYRLLRDLSYEELTRAVQHHIMSSPFPPTIADIRAAAARYMPQQADADMTELAAWELVRRAVSNSNYNAQKEFDKLPPLVRKAVGNVANLKEWASMDINTVNSVEQSHFIRAYRTQAAREKELQKLSPAMRNLMENASRAAVGERKTLAVESLQEDKGNEKE